MIRVKDRRIWLFRLFAIGLILALVPLAAKIYNPPLEDFIEYWSAARLTLMGENPYDENNLIRIQRPLGWQDLNPLMMWNPPWILPLIMPFALLPFTISRLLWYLFQLGILLFSADRLWRIYGGLPERRWVAWGAMLFSYSTIFLLYFGQISFLILLGIVLFITLTNRSNELFTSTKKKWWFEILAGGSAFLVSIKPQLFFLFFPILFLWAFHQRRHGIPIGILLGFLTIMLINIGFHSNLLEEYLQAAITSPPSYWATPTLGYWLRYLTKPSYFWLQFPSVLIGLGWGFWYWHKKKDNWNWSKEIPLLACISLITTAYGWTHDHILLLPASLQIIATITRLKDRTPSNIIIWLTVWLLFNLVPIPMHFGKGDELFVWLAPVFLGLYLWGLKVIPQPADGKLLQPSFK